MGKQQHEPHDELRQDIGHHVPCGDGEPARTETGGGRDEIGGCALEYFRAQDAGEARPVREGHADGDAPEPLAQSVGDEDEQHDVGNAHHEVDEPADRMVGPAGAQRRRGRQRERDERGGHSRHEAHEHAGGKAGQRAQEHVAAHPVGAERVRKRRGQALGGEIGRLGGRPRHETGHHNGSQQQRPAQGEREGTAAIGQPKAPRRREHGGLVGKNRISHQRPPSADAPGAYEDPPGRR